MKHPHPSGRPIREREVKGRTIWRVPDHGPVIPRLQKENERIEAIGFTADLISRTALDLRAIVTRSLPAPRCMWASRS
jgi:hypothetical protein